MSFSVAVQASKSSAAEQRTLEATFEEGGGRKRKVSLVDVHDSKSTAPVSGEIFEQMYRDRRQSLGPRMAAIIPELLTLAWPTPGSRRLASRAAEDLKALSGILKGEQT